ncbi:hypothetical protein [Armatimonas sp.]|uniref:hypothetical protein n=1 Tax=Armatimonas sp. TaxID=1872638 RepID=UPI0037506738
MIAGVWGMSGLGRPSTKPEIVGPYPEFARIVLQITGDVPRSTAAVHAGVSHDTIARMWRGEKVSADAIAKFAAGYGVDPAPLLKAGGHVHFVPWSTPTLKLEDDGELERISNQDDELPKIERVPVFPMPEGYNDLDDPIVRAAQAGAEEAYKSTFKSIADALRHARRVSPGTVMGPAPDDDED